MSDAETRLHFRIGYLGDAFHGSQIQPDVRTVQGELSHAFQKLGWISKEEQGHNLVLSSRTDAGVHVRVNGGTVRVARSLWDTITPRKFVRAVDDSCPMKLPSSMCVKSMQIGILEWPSIASTVTDWKGLNSGMIQAR